MIEIKHAMRDDDHWGEQDDSVTVLRKKNPLSIRRETADDYAAILPLTYEAFLTMDFPGRARCDEHYLIFLLQGAKYMIPELCFVAELDGEIVGHILYTKSKIIRPDGSEAETITFGPLSVLPRYHRQGIGSALVRHSLKKAGEMGFGGVLITGVPDYYPKLGFTRARDFGLTLDDGTAPDYFMAYELVSGSLSGGGVLHFLPPEFEISERDDGGFDTFHRKFMQEYYPKELLLRPLWDVDVPLLKRWLAEPHVAEWYRHPDDWLHEVNNRRDTFSFIKHFIVEFEGTAIGFCQYYDIYYGQKYEEWYWPEKALVTGELFSIDYLIGESDDLRRGYGKESVRQLTELVRAIPTAKTIAVEPESGNIPSQKVLLANGYAPVQSGEHRYFVVELRD